MLPQFEVSVRDQHVVAAFHSAYEHLDPRRLIKLRKFLPDQLAFSAHFDFNDFHASLGKRIAL